jgi:hypothetical protein
VSLYRDAMAAASPALKAAMTWDFNRLPHVIGGRWCGQTNDAHHHQDCGSEHGPYSSRSVWRLS